MELGPACGVSRKGTFSKDLFREVRDTTAESGSRLRTPGWGDEVQTGNELEFPREVCSQINQKIHRAAVSEYESSGFRKIPTKEKIIDRSVESYGPDEHHAMEKDYVRSPESDDLSGEHSGDDYLFEDIPDTDFSDVEELDDVAADETQMCTTECTVDTLENWTSSLGIDRQLVSATQMGQNDKAGGDQSNFAQLGKELEEWVQSQLNANQLSGSVSVEPTDEHQRESAGIDRTGKSDQKSMATVLDSLVYDDQQPRREDCS